MREVAAVMWTRGLGEGMNANGIVHGGAYGLVQRIELAIRLGMKLVMLGGILPARWWRRGLSVNCRSNRISATSVNRLLEGRVKCAGRPWCLAGRKVCRMIAVHAHAATTIHQLRREDPWLLPMKSRGVRRAPSVCWWKLPSVMSLQKTVI